LSKIQNIIDWDKVNAAVIDWAKSHHAEDPYVKTYAVTSGAINILPVAA
jgi:hypothetical protein